MEYNTDAISELISNLASVFSHSWKAFPLLPYAISCHTHALVDFEVISAPSIAAKCFDISGILKMATVKSVELGNNILSV